MNERTNDRVIKKKKRMTASQKAARERERVKKGGCLVYLSRVALTALALALTLAACKRDPGTYMYVCNREERIPDRQGEPQANCGGWCGPRCGLWHGKGCVSTSYK